MNRLKEIIRPYYYSLVTYKRNKTKGLDLFFNYIKDYFLYRRYSLVFRKKSIENKEADIILNYHSLEKGMLFYEMKKGRVLEGVILKKKLQSCLSFSLAGDVSLKILLRSIFHST